MRTRNIGILFLSGLCGIGAQAQSVQTAPPTRTITAPSPKQQQPPSGRQPLSPGTRAPQPILQTPGIGNVEGFVYWDTASISHVPASSCSGLEVNVAVGNSSGGKSTAYRPLGISTNSFKYVGEVKQFVTGGKIKAYDVCTYGYDHVPVGPDLKVTVIAEGSSPTQAGPFSPMSVPHIDPVGPINIINGQCNMLPRITNPTASDLFAHWGSCQNMVYDVNFVMQPSAHVMSSGGSGGVSAGTGAQRGMLAGNTQQQGTLASGAGSSAHPQSTEGGLLGNRGQASPSINGGTRAYTGTTRQSAITGSGGVNGPGITDPNRRSITDITNRGTASPATPGSKVELNPQPFPPRQKLTNADVIKMLKAGIPESVIVSSIQSSNKQFDFSHEKLEALQRAHVSPAVLAAMCDGSAQACPAIQGNSTPAKPGSKVELNPQPFPPGTNIAGQVGPGSKASLNPQPFPPKAKGVSPATTKLKPIKLAAPKALRKISNPRVSQQNASIIAVLQQQRQMAEQESSAMKLGIRSAATIQNSRATRAVNIQGNALTQGLGPSTTQKAQGNLSSSIIDAPNFNSIVLTCTNDPTPRVLRVSGGEAPAVFTPEAKYNLYTITGCSFGPSQEGNSAYIFGANGFRANLNIDFWNENGITAHLDPAFAGVLDQENVTLVVAPAGKQPFQKSGYKFYAARGMPGPDGNPQEIALAYDSMPQSKIGLFGVASFASGVDQLPSTAMSNFPNFSFQGTPVAGWVFRYSYEHDDRISALRAADCFINDAGFNGDPCKQFYLIGVKYAPEQWQLKSDRWDFSKLVPGFEISSYQLYVSTADPASLCGSAADMRTDAYLDGDWDFDLNAQNQIVVTWPVYRCTDVEFGTRDNMSIQSAYGLAASVMGPRCVDPWTGQKDQNCMNKIRQVLD
jgi:hypothetical protein